MPSNTAATSSSTGIGSSYNTLTWMINMLALPTPRTIRLTRLQQPLLVGIAKDEYLFKNRIHTTFKDPTHLGSIELKLGQDAVHGFRRPIEKYDMGNDIKSLKERFAYLKRVFASGDKSGVTDDIFNKFLSQARTGVDFFTDDRLTNKVKNHENINYFCDAAAKKVLASFFISKNSNDNTIRGPLYSNRRAIDFDGYKIIPPRNPITNLGLPAFNKGSKIFSTQDFDNGLGLLINCVQYAYIFVEEFGLNSIGIPKIRFKFLFYDVFGLDDDDLYEYGTSIKVNALGFAAAQGINSWWQLQHQFNYKPVITRIPITKEYTLYNKIVGVQGVGYGFDL